MELSKEILEALRWLDGMGYPFEAQFIKDMIPEPPEERTEEDLRENIRVRLTINKIASKFIKSRSEPIIESIDAIEELLVELDSISGEDHLNAYFTETCLEMIPNYVERIRKLVSARVEKIPSKKVGNYFRQAANCYIFGLYDAVAVLSRSVLEFSIEDTLRNNNIVIMFN